ncbi:MAG: hypothetical protein ABL901_05325 [Hyphomicrobiaceae bacterium]
MAIKPSDRARGYRMEELFQDWLNRMGAPYFYFDQTTFTVPANLRGLIKRPDFAIGMPSVGTLAFDVKAKTMRDGTFIIDLDEHKRLMMFENCFNMTVWFAVFPPRRAPYCWLFRNRDLVGERVIRIKGCDCLCFGEENALMVDHSQDDLMPAIFAYLHARLSRI